jgi:hypothetical protein
VEGVSLGYKYTSAKKNHYINVHQQLKPRHISTWTNGIMHGLFLFWEQISKGYFLSKSNNSIGFFWTLPGR